jgi:hypothetical protein
LRQKSSKFKEKGNSKYSQKVQRRRRLANQLGASHITMDCGEKAEPRHQRQDVPYPILWNYEGNYSGLQNR